MAETATLCTDCADADHHACIGRPECDCPCNDLAEQDEPDAAGSPTTGREATMGDPWTEKRTEGVVVDGDLYLPPNACAVCDKWFPPYKAGVPNETADLYCWVADHQEDA